MYHFYESYMYTLKPEIITRTRNFKPKICNQPKERAIWFFPLSRAMHSLESKSASCTIVKSERGSIVWSLEFSSHSRSFNLERIVHVIMGFSQKLHNLLHCGIVYHKIKIIMFLCFSKFIDIEFDQIDWLIG